MKKISHMDTFLDEVRKVPIIQVACEKSGISRNTVYRWKREDSDFEKEFEKAMADGVAFVNDMSESQLLTLIKEKNFSAVRFWLNKRHPAYKDKIEVTSRQDIDELNPEQEAIVRKALEMAQIIPTKQHEDEKQ